MDYTKNALALIDLICYAYDNGYYHNRLDTDTFDEMADAFTMQK